MKNSSEIREAKTISGEITGVIENILKVTQAKVGSWTYDFQEDTYFASEEVFRIFEVNREDYSGTLEGFYAFVHPEDVNEVKGVIKETLRGTALNHKFRILVGRGKEKILHVRAEQFYGDRRKQGKLIGLVQDITDQILLDKGIQRIQKEIMQGDYLRELMGVAQDLKNTEGIRDELKKIREQIHDVHQAFKMGSWVVDLSDGKVKWSPTTYKIYGVSPDTFEPTIEGVVDRIHEDDRERAIGVLRSPQEKNPFQMDFRIRRPDGKIRSISHLIERIADETTGDVIGLRGTIQDITEQRSLEEKVCNAQKQMVEMEKRFKILVENGDDVIVIIDKLGIMNYVSPAVKKLAGFSKAELEGDSLFRYFEEKELDKIKRLIGKSIKKPESTVKEFVVFRARREKPLYLELRMSNYLKDPTVKGIVMNWRDITHRVEMQRKITHIANHDDLTKLPNRMYFQRKVKTAIYRAEKLKHRLTVFMLDIDSFKQMNDSLRVGLGDELIVAASRRIQEILSEETVLCRYYGDQFGIMIEETGGIEKDQEMAEKLIKAFNKPFFIDQYELYITVSIGFSIFPEDGKQWEDLLKYAGTALLRAKEEGKNRAKAYSPALDIKNFKNFTLKNDLRKAIDEDQFILHLQPIVNLETGEILAAEVLTRWEHPEWGMVAPDEFIPLMEETGLIIDLGRQILRKVCQQYRDWIERGLPQIKISVNYSGVQFYQKNFVKDIQKTLKEFDLSPEFLIIEITESVLIKQSGRTLEDIKTLQEMGIQFAIDDFGTGYSSLTYLSSMRVDILKLDRGFIREVPDDERSNKILGAVVKLSQELRMKLVAEGIEDWDQLLLLRALHCVAGQGYIYREPVPVDVFEEILEKKDIQPLKNVTDLKGYDGESNDDDQRFFKDLIFAKMTIREFAGETADIGFTGTILKSIGREGLQFITNVQIPIRKDFILEFEMELFGESVKVQGFPSRVKKLEKEIFQYGLVFIGMESQKGFKLTLEKLKTHHESKKELSRGELSLEEMIGFFRSNRNFTDSNPW